jgi:hypothetical protein
VKTGDLLAIGPLVDLSELTTELRRGDLVQVAVESLGTLSLTIN